MCIYERTVQKRCPAQQKILLLDYIKKLKYFGHLSKRRIIEKYLHVWKN